MRENPAQFHDVGREANHGEPRQEQVFDDFERILSGPKMQGSVQKTKTYREFESKMPRGNLAVILSSLDYRSNNG
jgi:hypothetical protein